MSHDGRTPNDLILVPLADLHDVESEVSGLITQLDALTRLRPNLIRLQRVLREMDPERTPTHSHKPPDAAYRLSDKFARGDWDDVTK